MLCRTTADSVNHYSNANYNLTNLPRQNVLKAADPSYMDLLNLRTNFSMQEYDNLFGVTFRMEMVELYMDEEARGKKICVQSY